MAPGLSGMHREIVCADCRFPFSCDAKIYDAFPRAVCPNCGGRRTSLDAFPALAGDGVLVHRSLFQLRQPRRWEPVAFRLPDDPTRIGIKRIIGLPGETVRIERGNIYINGLLCRKNLADQKKTAILVHDADYRACRDGKPIRCWRCDAARSRWAENSGRFTRAPSPDDESVDWLRYHNLRFDPNQSNRIVQMPILDRYAYNQGFSRRNEEIHEVSDLMLSFRIIDIVGSGRLLIEAPARGETFRIEIDLPTWKWAIYNENMELQTGEIPKEARPSNETYLYVSLIDEQLLFAVNDRIFTICPQQLERSLIYPTSSKPPIFSIGIQNAGIVIDHLCIYRDVHYNDGIFAILQTDTSKTYKLSQDEYFVLGDNCPVSDDSRLWHVGSAVPGRFLIGRPIAVHFPVKRIELGKLFFQVPAPGKIRYIR